MEPPVSGSEGGRPAVRPEIVWISFFGASMFEIVPRLAVTPLILHEEFHRIFSRKGYAAANAMVSPEVSSERS